MSSTWFKSVSAFKKKIHYGKSDGGYDEYGYVLIAETAESNLINYNGGHDYHKWIMSCGDYFSVLRDVCRCAIDFDTGSSQWKPNHKDSCGFIRMCKKALEEAKDKDIIPYNIIGYIFWGSKQYDYIFDLFGNKENIEIKKQYDGNVMISQDMKTYITIKANVFRMIEDYKDRAEKVINFKDWINNHKDWYKFLT